MTACSDRSTACAGMQRGEPENAGRESIVEDVRPFLNVGDVIDFPNHAKGGGDIRGGAVYLPNGAPGKWRVTAIQDDGTVTLEPVHEPGNIAKAQNRCGW